MLASVAVLKLQALHSFWNLVGSSFRPDCPVLLASFIQNCLRKHAACLGLWRGSSHADLILVEACARTAL